MDKFMIVLLMLGGYVASAGAADAVRVPELLLYELRGNTMGGVVLFVRDALVEGPLDIKTSKALQGELKRELFEEGMLVVEESCRECLFIQPRFALHKAPGGRAVLVVLPTTLTYKGVVVAVSQERRVSMASLGLLEDPTVVKGIVELAAYEIFKAWRQAFGPAQH